MLNQCLKIVAYRLLQFTRETSVNLVFTEEISIIALRPVRGSIGA